jgi:hypothetical protein
MNLCKKTDKVLTELYSRKMKADKQWQRVFREVLHGNINQEELAWAMEECNVADQGLLDFDIFNKKLQKRSKGYSEEEFYRMYIEPYSKSRA